MSKRDVQITVGAKVDQAVSSFNRLQKTLYLNGRRLEGYGESIGKVFDPAMKGLLAVGATAKVAATGTGIAAYMVAQDLKEAMALVVQRTGEGGKALEEYEESVRKLFRENDVSGYKEVADALSTVRVASGTTGKALEELTQYYMSFADVAGADLNNSISLTSRLFQDWSISTDKQTEALDVLYVVSQKTGASVEGLAEKAVTYGTKFRTLGFSMEETIALLGKWEKEGVSTEKALAGLGTAITNMTRGGVRDLAQGWRDLTDRIKNARTEGEAINIAVKYFGSKAAPDMAAAIRENRFELGGLADSLSGVSGEVGRAKEKTTELGESLRILRNTAKDKLLIPLGNEVSQYVRHIHDLLEVLVEWVDANEAVKRSVDAFFEGLGLGKMEIKNFKAALDSIDVDSYINLSKELGKTLQKVYNALKAIAETVPWDSLIKNVDTLTKVIVYGWSAGKLMAIAGGIGTLAGRVGTLAGAFKKLKQSAAGVFARLAKEIGRDLNVIRYSGWKEFTRIRALLTSSTLGIAVAAKMGIEDLRGFNEALEGNREALDSLPEGIRLWIEKNKKFSDSMSEAEESADSMEKKLEELNSKLEEPLPEKRLVIEGPFFSNKDDLFAAWFKEDPTRSIAWALTDLQQRIIEFKEQGKDAMELFGVSALEADEIIRDSVMQVAEDLRKSLADESPYMATAFVNAMEKMGLDGGDALMTSIARAMGKKKDLPIKTLTGAIKEGFIKGADLTEAMKLIQGQSEEVAKKAGEAIEKELAGLGLSSRLMDSLKAYSSKLELANFGIQSTAPKLQGSGRSVKNVNAPVSVQIGTVNVGKPEDAKKTGQSLGEGIVRSFDLSY